MDDGLFGMFDPLKSDRSTQQLLLKLIYTIQQN